MPTLMEYECPACGGGLQFDSGLQKVKCPYCDTEFEVESMLHKDADMAEDLPQAESACFWQEDENIFTYICQSCGGEILCDHNTAATSCPYCDSPVVMKERLAGSLRPDLVIPFRLDKAAAKAALLQHTSLLCIANHSQCHTVLGRAAGVHTLQLTEDACLCTLLLCKILQFQQWGSANELTH